ncbi:MAG: hypothetical protein LUC48_03925 [Clostridiales bacterium]|nr:hypothetical protein [Clostridiales bacterium]
MEVAYGQKGKKEKKDFIRGKIDLGNGRFKDYEVDKLMDMVSNPNKYEGKEKTVRDSGRGISSDGRYWWQEESTYTIKNDDTGMRIEEDYSYKDDDGDRREAHRVYKTGREILNLIDKFFG